MKKMYKILFAFVLMAALLCGCSQSVNSVYDKEVNEINMPEIFFYYDEEATETAEKLSDVVQYVSLEEPKEIQRLKDRLGDFIFEVYEVDLYEKINNIETKFYVGDYSLQGFHEAGTNEVNINYDVIKDYPCSLASIWIHEVFHLLGFVHEESDPNIAGLDESLAEAVTAQAITWLGEVYFNCSYTYAARATAQMISVDPDLVVNVLTRDEYNVFNRINNVLKDVEYPMYEIPEDTSIGEQLGGYLDCAIGCNENYNILIDYTIQEITTAYCREFELTDKIKADLKSIWLIEDYDQITLKEDCYGFYLELV